MLITCKCLNVSMEIMSKPKGIPLVSLKLTPLEESHTFFSEGVAEVEEIKIIAKQIAALTLSETVGSWIVETCLNCALSYYAKNKDGIQPPLISAGLVADPNTIHALKNHVEFSPVFRIVIKQPVNSLLLEKKSVQTALFGLQQQFGLSVKKQAEKTDENIRAFTENQYDKLTEFRNRAISDHETLIRILHNAEAKDTKAEPLATPGSKMEPISVAKSASPLESDDASSTPRSKGRVSSAAVGITGRRTSGRSMFSPSGGMAASYDVEGVFNLEGMDESPPEHLASDGESDTDHDDSGSRDEGIDLRRKKSIQNLARSLPVNVPAFAHGGLQLHPVEFQSEEEPQDPMDIAASIKALALSVHGEAVFGDLPRPRFSTQI